VILGERLDLTSLENGQPKNGKARTVTGRVITTELLVRILLWLSPEADDPG